MSVSYVTEAIATQSTKSRHVTDRKLGKYLKSLVIFHCHASKQCDAYTNEKIWNFTEVVNKAKT